MDPSNYNTYLMVIWTLLINAVIIWTPLVVFLTKKLGRLEEIGKVTDNYGLDKISERVNAVEQLAFRFRDTHAGIPGKVANLEEKTVNLQTQIGDHPARVTALEVTNKAITSQLQDHPARVTALEVLTSRMQKDVEGVPSRVHALELIANQLQDDMDNIPAKIVAIELFQENLKAMYTKLFLKFDKLQEEHLRNTGLCGEMKRREREDLK